MNITLIYPNVSKEERYGSKIGESGGTQQLLGMACLGAFLKSKGFRVQLIDAAADAAARVIAAFRKKHEATMSLQEHMKKIR